MWNDVQDILLNEKSEMHTSVYSMPLFVKIMYVCR